MSRALYPKQLLCLASDHSMLQDTVARVSGATFTPPLVVCNEEHRFIVAEQLRGLNVTPRALVLEPAGRNTAPAVAIAALLLAEEAPAALLLVMPSDHVITKPDTFKAAIDTAAEAAADGGLVTFGITPTAPETGYGYIKAPGDGAVRTVDRFVEKPDRATAEGYLAEGTYFWNAGIFLFRADRYLEELERFEPAMLAACRKAVAGAKPDLEFQRLDAEAFGACPSVSIDYAVMERTDAAKVVPVDMGWSDVGAWSALWDIGEKDADGNHLSGDVLLTDTRNCYLRSEDKLVAAVGVEDLVVVSTGDAVLVASKDKAQDVKAIVETLGAQGRTEGDVHTTVYRPWGSFRSIDQGERYQVKLITVKPGGSLSLQMHHHRAEHWIVVNGTARVTRGDDVLLLHENQSVYIPLGTTHRLENPGKLPLHLIEVQSGSYLGEDDIVRFEDTYGRS